MAIDGGHFGSELVKVLGLPKETCKITFTAEALEAVKVNVVYYAEAADGTALLELLQHYELVPKGEPEVRSQPERR